AAGSAEIHDDLIHIQNLPFLRVGDNSIIKEVERIVNKRGEKTFLFSVDIAACPCYNERIKQRRTFLCLSS
ncbi:MAG: hypothetical protein IKM08_09795, partial [Clostridia bacterium]|nr:hypothetical protein [Clostridia bacterium]